MKNGCRVLTVWAALALQSAVAAAEAHAGLALGTLFYTPAQRLEITRARRPEAPSDALSQAASKDAETSYLQGVVRRSNGKSTVWVNGKPLPEGQVNTPPLQGVDAVVNGKRLRVGQSLDKSSGTRSDVVEPGSLTLGVPP